MKYFDLNRRFVERKTYAASELIAAEVAGQRVEWDAVLSGTPCIVIGPANFGKTTEMRERAKLLRGNSEHAVFIALRRLAERNTAERALETEELEAFRAWKTSRTAPLTLFVDSLDEASSSQREGIESLVNQLADEISWPSSSVRWVISTRPAVLTDDVIGKLRGLLCRSAETARLPASSPEASKADAQPATTSETTTGSAPTLRVYSMVPLESTQAKVYLNSQHSELDAGSVLATAYERGLAGFTRSPGGLDILANIDLLSNPPSCLTEVFARVATAMQTLRGSDGRLLDVATDSSLELESAARRLASATQVCQLINIDMPAHTLAVSADALSARLITSPLLNEDAIKQLLNTQLFIDVGYHQVKMYPDEMAPFLAAQRLSELAQSPDQAHRLLQNFAWTAPSGEMGVHRQYLPLMGWLATLNAHCRRVILELDPQALALFGDLRNADVPLEDAKHALAATLRRQVEQGDRPGRGMFNLTSENYWQAGASRLEGYIAELFDQFGSHYWARDTLMEIVIAARLDNVRLKVLARHAQNYDALLNDHYDLRYLLEIGNETDLKGLAAAIKTTTTARESTVATILGRLGWSYFSPGEAARLVAKQFLRSSEGFNTGLMLDSTDFLSSATDAQLYGFCRGLVVRLPEEHEPSLDLDKFMAKTVDAVAALVSRPNSAKPQRVALLCLLLHKKLVELAAIPDKKALSEALQHNTTVRRHLLAYLAQRRGRSDNELLFAVAGYDRLCNYTPEDVAHVNDLRLNSVYADFLARTATPSPPPPTPTRRTTKRRADEVSKDRAKWLQEILPELRAGKHDQGLSWVANWLLNTTKNSRYGDVDFTDFGQKVGAEVAAAASQGLRHLWRERAPRFDENQPHTTYHITAAGLQGLHLDLGDGSAMPSLSEAEVRRAFRYGTFEINGYPEWFWPLANAHRSTAIDELTKIANERSNGPVSRAHADTLLTLSHDAPSEVRSALATLAWTNLNDMPAPGVNAAESLLKSVLVAPPSVSASEFGRVALKKMQSAFSSETLAGPPDSELIDRRSEAAMWGGRWLTTFPDGFRKAVEAWGPNDPQGVRVFLLVLAAHFGRDRAGALTRLAKSGAEGIVALEHLCLWVRWAVDEDEDAERPEGILFHPGPRENAEQLRDSLVNAIASADSQQAYDALSRIQAACREGPFKDYLPRVRFELRERQFQRPALPQRNYNDFERHLQADVTDAMSFSMAVHSDLLAVKYDLEQGEHSLRNFFSGLDFARVNKRGEEGKQAGLALEADFQRLLGSELNHHARRRYSVSLEPETAEKKRRDVLCSRDDWRASIELKMSERWTLDDYIEALEKQLVGQYMRHRNATTGFLVIVLQTKDRKWTDTSTGSKVGFNDLVTILATRAQSLEAKDSSLYLRVVGIDATPRGDFRAERPASRRGARGSASTRSTSAARRSKGR